MVPISLPGLAPLGPQAEAVVGPTSLPVPALGPQPQASAYLSAVLL
jgi:hypothetical protein